MYKCRVCGKLDRRQRLVGHLLKTHVSLDQVPYYCNLCNFRCTAKEDLARHVTNYKRHREEVGRFGLVNHKSVLQRSSHPVDVDSLMEVCEISTGAYSEEPEDFFSDQGTNEMPDWLRCEEFGKMPAGAPAFAAVAPPRLSQEIGETASLEVSDILPTISAEDLQGVLSPSRMWETQKWAEATRRMAGRPSSTSTCQLGSMTRPEVGQVMARPHPEREMANRTECSISRGHESFQPIVSEPRVILSGGQQTCGTSTVTQPTTGQPVPCRVSHTVVSAARMEQSPTIYRSLFSTPVQDEPECTFNALIGLKDRTDPLQTEEETRRVRDNAVRTEKSEEKEKQHTLEIVNAVVASQQEIVKALRENGRELRAVFGAVQTLANEQKSMRQCFESFKRELTGLPCKRKLEDNSGSRSKENKRPEKRGDRRDR